MNTVKGILMFLGTLVLIAAGIFGGYKGYEAIQVDGYRQCEYDTKLAVSKAEKEAAPVKAEAEKEAALVKAEAERVAKAKAEEDKAIRQALIKTTLQLQKSESAVQRAARVDFNSTSVRFDTNVYGTGGDTLYFVRSTSTGEIVDLTTSTVPSKK